MPTWDGTGGATGYRHAAYAQSLVEFGTPRSLTRCGGWILEREIANAGARDGMGCYPLFACRDWGALGAGPRRSRLLPGLASPSSRIPSVSESPTRLRECVSGSRPPLQAAFHLRSDRPLKSAVSPQSPLQSRTGPTLRRRSTSASRHMHGRRPGTICIMRSCGGMASGVVALFPLRHWPASSRFPAWSCSAPSMATRWSAWRSGMCRTRSPTITWRHRTTWATRFARRTACSGAHSSSSKRPALTAVDLGAAAGRQDVADGLSRFKRGWATGQRTAYLCGRILRSH